MIPPAAIFVVFCVSAVFATRLGNPIMPTRSIFFVEQPGISTVRDGR
jgi:hypothetical protein